jgi:hypothetical protein
VIGWGRWPYSSVRVTHLSSGISATANEARSQHRCYQRALHMLKGKLWRMVMGPQPLVRSYEIPDDVQTIPDLETGACIDRSKPRV